MARDLSRGSSGQRARTGEIVSRWRLEHSGKSLKQGSSNGELLLQSINRAKNIVDGREVGS